ncbi:N-acetyl-alpha-D-glucosaminyl L-malate synthase BshA [Alteribacillus persepolensis]|uniref:N-acetyl-alpha-D-glucosaminyl L-malate synthase BshA n=1 Tax=Alteribacillus persepolensis TaxID=568899 RepID=A0A1G7ZDR9_9BACI|nr:N-acetyl-alpha-D-glucosaminyl L-malate synthase BshA [Alteribacillus persepolensis]SDH06789.1 N-acetyl-alpha-D-glucosaminyl L-malate synthase BshA [Alteribacillus persepolensis]
MKQKIGISCYPTVGGSGVVATELGKLLAEKGHEIHFISTSMPFRLNKTYPNIYYHEVEVSQFEVFQYPPYSLTLASKMAEVIEREQLDVLHVHYAVPHAVCALLAKDMVERDIKVVTTLHGTDITVLGHDSSLKPIIKYAIERSDKVTAVSQALASQTKESLHITRPIETIYNFIDERVYKPQIMKNELKHAYHIQEHEKIVVHISNFRPVKRVVDVVEAFHVLHEHTPSKLLMIGDGPDRNKAYRHAVQRGISEDVLFLGSQKNIVDFLNIADIMFLLSEKESFGLAALEAMACGVPVIGTDTGGIPEVIVNNETGYTCPVGDAEEAGLKALHLLQHPLLYEAFSSAGKARVEEVFASSLIVEYYESIYHEVSLT